MHVGPVAQVLAAADLGSAVESLQAAGPVAAPALRELFDSATRLAQADAASCRRLIQVCLALADEAGAPDLKSACRYLEARLCLNEGRPEAAMGLIGQARDGWLSLDRPLDAFRTELGRMHVLDDLGRHAEAATAARELLDDLARHATPPGSEEAELVRWMRAAALENLGVALGLMGGHERALEAYATAESIHAQSGDPADVARLRGNQGVELIALGRPVDALSALASAAELFIQVGDQHSHAMCLSNMVEAEMLLGRYAASLDRFALARAALADQGAWPELCRLQLRAVRAYLALNLDEEAAALVSEAVHRLETLGLAHDLASARWLAAAVALRSGDLDDAAAHVDQALAGAQEVADTSLQVRAELVRSEILEAAGDRVAAAVAAGHVLRLVQGGSWPAEELQVHLRLSALADDDQRRQIHVDQAHQLAERLSLPHLHVPVLLELARVRRSAGLRDEALDVLSAAVDLVEQLRWLIPDEGIRTSYLNGRTAAHTEAVSILIESDDAPEHRRAFALAEAAKARTLSDILAGGLSHGPAPAVPGQARLTGAALPSAGQVAADPADQLVEYHVVDGGLVAFVWRDGELRIVQGLAPIAAVVELLGQWDRQLRRRQLDNGVAPRHLGALTATARRVLAQLGHAVFAPVAEVLDPGQPDLLVVPHGPLHRVPFHALVVGGAVVGRTWDITLAASHAVADRIRRRPSSGPTGRSLVVGVPDESAPAVAVEAEAVSRLLPGAQLLLGPDATPAAVWSACAGCDVIHLACHGVHRAANPMYSSLRLADSWVTARDVLELRLTRPLVVLSACESGRQNGPGPLDEAIGFARSFVAAGADAVVVSLWLANDEVTCQLMVELYQGLASGLRPPAALARAQSRVAEEHPHPCDWAPFVLHGAPPPLEQ